MRVRVKICGVTSVEDALVAAAAGADAVGFVLHEKSRRTISRETAAAIVRVLPPFVTPVGLFADTEAQEILDICAQLNLRTVQLHGDECPEILEDLSGLAVIKAIIVQKDQLEKQLERWRGSSVCGITVDSGAGSGKPNDWDTIRVARERGLFKALPPLIAAGGLTPQTVADVVRTIQPYAVDVSSGVEQSLGKKSKEKVVEFIHAARSAG